MLILLPLAFIGAAMGRWTRVHPLWIAAIMGVSAGVLGIAAMAAFVTEGGAILIFGGIAFIIGASVGAFGAFAGWLRRHHSTGNG